MTRSRQSSTELAAEVEDKLHLAESLVVRAEDISVRCLTQALDVDACQGNASLEARKNPRSG